MVPSKLLITVLVATAVDAVSLHVDSSRTKHELSPLFYGLMFEDISNSGDGGIYAQQLRNNAFQGDVTDVHPWDVIYGGARLEHDPKTPLTTAIPASLKVVVPEGSQGDIGVSNPGFRGIIVDGGYYTSTFHLKGTYTGTIKLRLVGASSNVEYAWHYLDIESTSDKWTKFEAAFWTTASPEVDNLFVFEFRAENMRNGYVNIGYPTLFPETFRGRQNGLNRELSETLVDLKPSFLRFPGGNNMQGSSANRRWKWNETLGPLEDRPGRWGTWGYPNTDGLGLMEYLQWCEDMILEPLLTVWAGIGVIYGGKPPDWHPPLIGDELEPFVEDALRQIEFIIGDKTTAGGALRASLGHPEPYHLKFVGIGNEDNLSEGCESYPQRFTQFFDAIHAVYPQLVIVASTVDRNCLPNPLQEGVWLDFHNYNHPEGFVDQYNGDIFSDWDRAHPILVGEYARWGVTWSDMQGACAEAVFLMACENNADLVKMTAFAPALQNYDPNGGQWTPNLIPFQNKLDGIVLSTSYHVLKMFSNNHGDFTVPVTADTEQNPVFWSASKKGDQFIVKLANFGPDTEQVSITIPGKAGVETTYMAISGVADAGNNMTNPKNVLPQSVDIAADDEGKFSLILGQYGVAVLTV